MKNTGMSVQVQRSDVMVSAVLALDDDGDSSVRIEKTVFGVGGHDAVSTYVTLALHEVGPIRDAMTLLLEHAGE